MDGFRWKDAQYIISTHAKCFDGAAAGALLALYLEFMRVEFQVVPHVWSRSFLREAGIGNALQCRAKPVAILMFDVSPDQELVDAVLARPDAVLVVGDHHIGTKPFLDSLRGRPQISVMYDTEVSGADLARMWIQSQLAHVMTCTEALTAIRVALDSPCGTKSQLLETIGASDLGRHRHQRQMLEVDAALRLCCPSPTTETIKELLKDADAFAKLCTLGPAMYEVRTNLCRTALSRGRRYLLTPTAMDKIRVHLPDIAAPLTVLCVNGDTGLASDMAFHRGPGCEDMLWVWTKVELLHKLQYTVSVRRMREDAAGIRCDVVAAALCPSGSGHASAAGMAFDAEPTALWLTTR